MKTTVVLGLTFAAVALGLSGCSGSGVPNTGAQSFAAASTDDRPIFLIAMIDASDSGTEEDKLAYGRVVLENIESLHRDRDQLRVFIFDHSVREVCSEVPADSESYALSLKDSILRPIACHACGGLQPAMSTCRVCGGTGRERITSQGQAIAAVADALKDKTHAGFQVRVLVATDGGYEDHSAAAEKLYKDSVTVLGSVPQIKVKFWGVRPGFREDIRSKFGPIDLKGNFQILGNGEEVTW